MPNAQSAFATMVYFILPVFLLINDAPALAQKFVKQGNIVTYRGNKFEIGRRAKDTLTEIDPATGNEVMKIMAFGSTPVAIRMNGSKIFNARLVNTKPNTDINGRPFEEYILKGMSPALSKLADGSYTFDLGRVVVDTKGKVVYYEYHGIYQKELTQEEAASGQMPAFMKLPADMKELLEKRIEQVLTQAPAVKPGMKNGRAVVTESDIYTGKYRVTIKGHKVAYAPK